MTLAEHYAGLAVHFRAKASSEKIQTLKAEWDHLADCYGRLAEQSQSFNEVQHLTFLVFDFMGPGIA